MQTDRVSKCVCPTVFAQMCYPTCCPNVFPQITDTSSSNLHHPPLIIWDPGGPGGSMGPGWPDPVRTQEAQVAPWGQGGQGGFPGDQRTQEAGDPTGGQVTIGQPTLENFRRLEDMFPNGFRSSYLVRAPGNHRFGNGRTKSRLLKISKSMSFKKMFEKGHFEINFF